MTPRKDTGVLWRMIRKGRVDMCELRQNTMKWFMANTFIFREWVLHIY